VGQYEVLSQHVHEDNEDFSEELVWIKSPDISETRTSHIWCRNATHSVMMFSSSHCSYNILFRSSLVKESWKRVFQGSSLFDSAFFNGEVVHHNIVPVASSTWGKIHAPYSKSVGQKINKRKKKKLYFTLMFKCVFQTVIPTFYCSIQSEWILQAVDITHSAWCWTDHPQTFVRKTWSITAKWVMKINY
jgi:hypothetical protein